MMIYLFARMFLVPSLHKFVIPAFHYIFYIVQQYRYQLTLLVMLLVCIAAYVHVFTGLVKIGDCHRSYSLRMVYGIEVLA